MSALGTPLGSPLRWFAAAMMFVAAAVHVPLVPEHLEEAAYVGVLFIALAVVGAVLTVLLMVHDSRPVWTVSGVVGLLSVVAFVASRTVGLPQITDDIGNWTEPLGYPALASEALVTIVAALALRHTHHPLTRRSSS